jgi:His/Glu/Gln/Arg/opine family amino acid ABC transporter permease subunit
MTDLSPALDLVAQSAPLLLKGAGYTVLLSLIGMGVGLVIGFGLALMRLSRSPLLRWPAAVYVSAIRGTPLLVQLFLIYYGLPQLGINCRRCWRPGSVSRSISAPMPARSCAAPSPPSTRASGRPPACWA